MLYYTTKGTDKESEYDKLREEVNNKINEIKDKIYISKASIIGPGMPFGFNTLSFIALHILPIPIKNIFVSSGLNLPFTKDIVFTILSLGWYKGLRKNRVALENENSSEKYSRNESTYNPYLIGNQLKGILPEDFLSQNPGLISDSGADEAQTIVPKLLLNKMDKERKGRKILCTSDYTQVGIANKEFEGENYYYVIIFAKNDADIIPFLSLK